MLYTGCLKWVVPLGRGTSLPILFDYAFVRFRCNFLCYSRLLTLLLLLLLPSCCTVIVVVVYPISIQLFRILHMEISSFFPSPHSFLLTFFSSLLEGESFGNIPISTTFLTATSNTTVIGIQTYATKTKRMFWNMSSAGQFTCGYGRRIEIRLFSLLFLNQLFIKFITNHMCVCRLRMTSSSSLCSDERRKDKEWQQQ